MRSRSVIRAFLGVTIAALVFVPLAAFQQHKAAPRTLMLTRNVVHTQHVIDRAITFPKLQAKAVTVNVNAAATTGSSAADPTLVGGTTIGWRSAGNQDQLIDNIVLNADGSITVTLAAAATAQNNFVVTVVGVVGNF
jgi:hypothetical protein